MKTTHSPSLLWPAIGYVAMILIAATMSLSATTHTWIGDSGIWSASSDWSTGSIPVSEDSLIFTGDNTYTYNDLTSTITLRHITFDANASGPFEVEGNAFNIGGTITNNSDYEVTIWNDIQIVGGGGTIPYSWNQANRDGLIVDVGHAGMSIGGNITLNNNSRVFAKEGKGTLTLTGNNVTSFTMIRNGTLIQDGRTLGQSGGDWQRRLSFGTQPAADQPQNMGTGTLILRNGATAIFHIVDLFAYGGGSSIVVENGSTLTTGDIGYSSASYGEGNSFDFRLATLNIDLSDGGVYNNAGTDGFFSGDYTTVTVDTVNGNKTGFVYRNNELVTSGTPFIGAFTGGTVSHGARDRFTITGDVVVTGVLNTVTLTITGAGGGSLTGVPTSTFTSNAFLMEEGTGNYLIDKRWTNTESGGTRYVHQYSTDGVLTFGQNITSATSQHFIKTGPGTVVFAQGATSDIGRQTEIQGGRFILDGTFGETTHFRVRGDDAILSGQGSIGGLGGTPVYTLVQIFNGGTLDGNYHATKALDITGSLTFLSDGQYRVDLHADPLGTPLTVLGLTGDSPQAAVVTLGGDLLLSLLYQPTPYGEDPIVLLRTTGSIIGSFDTINGDPFILGNLLTLSYVDQEYWFELGQMDLGGGYTGLVLYTIPEPSTVALLSSVALLGWVYFRRRRS